MLYYSENRFKKWVAGIFILLIICLFSLVYINIRYGINISTFTNKSIKSNTKNNKDILIINNLHEYMFEYEDIFKYLKLVKWDKLIINDYSLKPQEVENLEKYFQNWGVNYKIISNYNKKDVGYWEVDDGVEYIFLEPYQDECDVPIEVVNFLKDAINQESKIRVIINANKIPLKEECRNQNRSNVWLSDILPFIQGKVKVVVSYGSDNIEFKDIQGVTFVSNNLPALNSNAQRLYFTRIQVDDFGGIKVNRALIIDPAKLKDLPTDRLPVVKVYVDNRELDKLYVNCPFYNWDAKWNERTEKTLGDKISKKIKAKINLEGREYDGYINIRGDVGNHWMDIRKSWTITFKNKEHRQIKLILPRDRWFDASFVTTWLSQSLGIPTPNVSLNRLFINDYDMGVYLNYEDFDKAFLELRGYNSDATLGANLDLDVYNPLSIYEDLNFIEVKNVDDKHNKTQVQKIAIHAYKTSDLSKYFDVENITSWLALQVYLNDRHQNSGDNMRFFVDLPTGKIMFITWDAIPAPFLNTDRPYILSNNYGSLNFQYRLLQNPYIRDLTFKKVCNLLVDQDKINIFIDDLRSQHQDLYNHGYDGSYALRKLRELLNNNHNFLIKYLKDQGYECEKEKN